MRNFKISASIASSDLLNVQNEIDFVDTTYGYLHIDIEDGNYIPNITFGKKMMKLICESTKSDVSVHLMVNHPEDYLECLIRENIKQVFIHLDHIRYPLEVLHKFQQRNINIGIAFNPLDDVAKYSNLLTKVNHVMLMTSEPDGKEQQFQNSVIDKIHEIRNAHKIEIWIDGGIDQAAFEKIQTWPIDFAVLGRLVFQDKQRRIL